MIFSTSSMGRLPTKVGMIRFQFIIIRLRPRSVSA